MKNRGNNEVKRVIVISLLFFFTLTIISASPFGYDTEETGTTEVTQLNITDLDDLSDVNVPTPTNNHVLTWNATSSRWEDQSAASVGDTNETTRFDNLVDVDCSGTDKVVGVFDNGTVSCGADETSGGGGLQASSIYLYNDTTYIYFNTTLAGTNLSVNSSDYWDNLDTFNSSELEIQSDGNLGILNSFIDILIDNRVTQSFVKALGFYDDTEVYNKTESDDTNTSNNNYILYVNSTNPGGLSSESDPFWEANYTAYNDSWSLDNFEADTNETTRVDEISQTHCAGDVLVGFFANGTGICEADDTGGTSGGNTTEEIQDAFASSLDSNFTYEDANNVTTVNGTSLSSYLQTFFDSIYHPLWDYDFADLINVAIDSADIVNGEIKDVDLDLTNITINDFTNDASYITNDTMNKTVYCGDITGGSDGDFCVDSTGSGGNVFDQDLNTTDDVIFNSLNITDIIRSNDWSNVTITETQISDLSHYTDADIDGSETAFDGWDKDASNDFDGQYSSLTGIDTNACAGTDKVTNVTFDNGVLSIICDTDETGGTSSYTNASGDLLYNDTATTIFFNRTQAGNDLAVNSSDYWDNLDTFNSSELEIQSDGNLGILNSFIDILIDNRVTQSFVKALGFYDDTEVYNKTESDDTNTSNNNYILYVNSTNPGGLSSESDPFWEANYTAYNDSWSLDNFEADTNETPRFDNLTGFDCGGTDKVVGVFDNGTVSCGTDETSGGTADVWVNETGEDWNTSQHIVPASNDSYTLGNTTRYYATLFVKTLNIITQITTSQIADAAITTAKIAVNSITAEKVAPDAINTTHIVDGTITGSDTSANFNSTYDTRYISGTEADLNVNSSNYWDSLDTPSDISTGDLNDDNTFVQTVGDTMTGNLNVSNSNITLGDANNNNRLCLTQDCSSYMFYNGTGVVIQG